MFLFVRKKAYTLLDRYDVIDDTARLVLTADGKLTRFRGQLVMRDRAGQEVMRIFKSPNPLYANYTMTAQEKLYASMRQQLSVKPTFEIQSDDGNYLIRGNLQASEFVMLRDDAQFGEIKRKYLQWGDCYVLEFSNTQFANLCCALVIALDNAMYHNI
jgi:uncharacterized protein YxjI